MSIVFLWGAILSFGNPLNCPWPSLDELMAMPRPRTFSYATGLEEQAAVQLEEVVTRAIFQRGGYPVGFSPERDFIQHLLPGSTRVWQYKADKLISVDEGIALAAMRSPPVDQATFFAGEFPRLFRFTIVQAEAKHACVIVERVDSVGGTNTFSFWQLFRSGFGLGPWWAAHTGGWSFGY